MITVCADARGPTNVGPFVAQGGRRVTCHTIGTVMSAMSHRFAIAAARRSQQLAAAAVTLVGDALSDTVRRRPNAVMPDQYALVRV